MAIGDRRVLFLSKGEKGGRVDGYLDLSSFALSDADLGVFDVVYISHS